MATVNRDSPFGSPDASNEEKEKPSGSHVLSFLLFFINPVRKSPAFLACQPVCHYSEPTRMINDDFHLLPFQIFYFGQPHPLKKNQKE